MTNMDPLALAGAKSKGKRPYFLEDNDVERLSAIVMTIAQELSVMRERLDTIERLLERKGAITRADIENFEPTKADADERGAWTQEYIARVLRVLQQDREAMGVDEMYSEDVAEELAKT